MPDMIRETLLAFARPTSTPSAVPDVVVDRTLKPLLLIQHTDCVTAAFGDKAASAKCETQFDRAIQDWKDAQKKKAKK